MPAERINALTPFGVLMGDTYPFPSVELLDGDGNVVDPVAMTVTLERWNSAGVTSSMAGTIVGLTVEFPWSGGGTDASEIWQTMVSVDDGNVKHSLSSPNLSVYDTQAMWASIADVERIVGVGVYSQWDILAAIQVAESAVRTRVTLEAGSPVPTRVRQATATLAARVLTSGSGAPSGDAIIEERIADYSVRYAEASSGGALTLDDEIRDLLLPWWPRVYASDIAEKRASDSDDEFYAGVI